MSSETCVTYVSDSPLSAISYPLSAISYGSRISNNRFLPVNVSPSMVVRPEDGERGGGGIAVATLKAESRKPKAESRKLKAESRKLKAESRKRQAIHANSSGLRV
jgi:hypothetical protein